MDTDSADRTVGVERYVKSGLVSAQNSVVNNIK